MKKSWQGIGCAVFLTAVLCACGSATKGPSDREASITAAALTAARPATTVAPSATSSPTPELSPTLSLTATLSPSATRPVIIVGPVCDNAIYLSDVTIPDGSAIDPGDEFTKTWRIQNTGTCEWTTSYAIAFVSGDKMDGQTTALTDSAEAGEAIDVSVKLAAPEKPGTYTGYWRMQNASGAYFGQLVYVQIKVPGGAGTVTTAPTATGGAPTDTAAPTVTPTALPTDTPNPG